MRMSSVCLHVTDHSCFIEKTYNPLRPASMILMFNHKDLSTAIFHFSNDMLLIAVLIPDTHSLFHCTVSYDD